MENVLKVKPLNTSAVERNRIFEKIVEEKCFAAQNYASRNETLNLGEDDTVLVSQEELNEDKKLKDLFRLHAG